MSLHNSSQEEISPAWLQKHLGVCRIEINVMTHTKLQRKKHEYYLLLLCTDLTVAVFQTFLAVSSKFWLGKETSELAF